jgi:hypothetical protein
MLKTTNPLETQEEEAFTEARLFLLTWFFCPVDTIPMVLIR